MGFQINNNLGANNAFRNLNNTQNDMNKSLERLSSGLRINRAADDAAGLSISEGLRSQVSGLGVAQRNTQDGISVIGVAEGALSEVHAILHRQRDLAVQAGNDSNNAASRTAIKTESDALSAELTRIAASTNFNGIKLLDGSDTALTFQVGAGGVAAEDQIDVALFDVTAVATATAALTFDSSTNAAASVTALDTQIAAVSAARSGLGASQNRLESAGKSLAVAKENLGAAESRIRDTDMAEEMVKYTKANILSQAGVSMLAQANQSNQSVLKLLG
ncbi:flagellin domain-containing protein [Arthrobacter crystallopoietes BAB-32]|uniref:Flagellin n=1 Tax=Arthrobacter crystallopoietes BAB-32 TaxID=1246476 RepID=N1UYE3_9MICC|nr:flagellin [Arthrobacter crystallopoietes]EMY34090.1 flagellin domain-containing protein [Arthrobacter crystallopoietes BAB-32]